MNNLLHQKKLYIQIRVDVSVTRQHLSFKTVRATFIAYGSLNNVLVTDENLYSSSSWKEKDLLFLSSGFKLESSSEEFWVESNSEE